MKTKERSTKLSKVFIALMAAGLLLTGCASASKTEDEEEVIESTPATIANPWIECETLHEAEHLAGFEVSAFTEFNGLERSYIAVLDNDSKIVEVRYGDDVTVRKAPESDTDISGDYNEYTWTTENDDAIFKFTAEGNKEGVVNLATWTKDGYAYSISSVNGLSLEDAYELVTEVTTLSFKEVKDLDEANSLTGFITTVNKDDSYTASTMETFITQVKFSDGLIARKTSNFPNIEGVARIFEELDVDDYSYAGSMDVNGTTVLMLVSSEDTVNCIQWVTSDSAYLIYSVEGFSQEDIPTLIGYIA